MGKILPGAHFPETAEKPRAEASSVPQPELERERGKEEEIKRSEKSKTDEET